MARSFELLFSPGCVTHLYRINSILRFKPDISHLTADISHLTADT